MNNMKGVVIKMNSSDFYKSKAQIEYPANSDDIGKIPPCSQAVKDQIHSLCARHPFIKFTKFGESVSGKPLLAVAVGNGQRRVIYSASHHANEWITTNVLLRFLTELCEKVASDGEISGCFARELLRVSCLCFVPLINPDGVDLVTGNLTYGTYYDRARQIANHFPEIPFPEGWKANINGVDLNLQYPARWEKAKEIKLLKGFDRPSPRDYAGSFPLCEPESVALASITAMADPDLVVAFHSQGKEIYWKFGDSEPEGSRELGLLLAEASGYELSDTPSESANAGYKDWFIQEFKRPGYTIEVGLGENPLPLSQFDEIYTATAPLIVKAAIGRD